MQAKNSYWPGGGRGCQELPRARQAPQSARGIPASPGMGAPPTTQGGEPCGPDAPPVLEFLEKLEIQIGW